MLTTSPHIEIENLWDKLGIPCRGLALFSAIEKGFQYEVFPKMADLIQIDKNALAASLSISSATLYRRAKAGHFNSDESDKLYRFITVFSVALALFENDHDAATVWLQSDIEGLGGNRPIDMLSTSAGCDAVTDTIGRLEHGVFA